MRVAFCGFTTHIATSHLVFLPVNLLHLRKSTQCPELIIQCLGVITKCPGIMIMCPEIAPLRSLVMRACAPLENIPSSVWHNSNLSSRSSDCPPVPRNNVTDIQQEQQKTVSPPPKKKRNRFYRRERRARERAERGETFNHDVQWATQRLGAPPSSSVPDQVTQPGLQDSDPISAMRPAVYYPRESVGNPAANENSPF